MEVNIVKGTHDVLADETLDYGAIEGLLKQVASLFGYLEVRPPVIEHSELFVRSVGESSDVVRKEMYTFLDKGDRSLTLRPEFTAGIMRLIVSNKLYATNELPLKYFYLGPVFRYERPQLGRYRQFNQFGVESVGNASLYNDVEVISLAYTMLISLGLQNVKLKINSLGDEESRNNYREALKQYFSKHIDNMCPDCKERYNINPLRILDCKVPEDIEIVKGAPKMSDYLSKESEDRFNKILTLLNEMEIPYEFDDSLVRGLDYYSETVFEFHYTSSTGANYGAIGAGGHYSNLLKELGGPDLPGIGFSFGIERLYSILKDDNLLPPEKYALHAYVMPMGEECMGYALNVANELRMAGYYVDMCFDQVKLGNMFKRAEKKNAKTAIIIGENEMNNHSVVLKNLKSQQQIEIPLDELVSSFDEMSEEHHCHHHHHEEGKCCCGHNHDHGEGCGHHHDEGEECCCHHKEK